MAYLVRTPSSAGNRKTFTMSAWLKPNVPSSGSISMFSAWSADNVAGHFVWRIKTDGTIGWSRWSDDSYSTRKLLDTNGWYHCVIAVDTTQATASDRVKLYVNNEQITSFSVGATYPAQNTDLPVNNTNSQTIGLNNYSSGGNPYAGYMSHFHLVDGTALTPSAFGETDTTTGEWKIKTSPSVTYGTNGFFMFKDDNSANDDSGQSNNFTLSGTLPKSEDNPSNVFATLNPLVNNAGEMMLLTNGNTSCQSNAAQGNSWKLAVSTLGMTSGKYYWEIKFDNVHNCYNNGVMGSNILTANTSNPMNQIGYTGFYNIDGGEIRKDNVVTTQDYGTYATNDIMGVACDMDNHTITFYKNGSAFVSNVALSTTGRDVVFPCSVFYNTNNTGIPQASYNFGNGYFGTTAVATNSGNGYAGAEGSSIFNYQPPTGYTALSTKGLNL